jgi:hypothetical protein
MLLPACLTRATRIALANLRSSRLPIAKITFREDGIVERAWRGAAMLKPSAGGLCIYLEGSVEAKKREYKSLNRQSAYRRRCIVVAYKSRVVI